MRKLIFLNKFFLIIVFFTVFFNTASYAYIGLAPLLPILGNIILLIFVFLLSVFGFIVYPIKKISDKIKSKKKSQKKI